MSSAAADPGSFRDPGGCVFVDSDRVLRAVYPAAAANYEAARDAGILADLSGRGLLVESREIDPGSTLAGKGASHLLEHRKLPFVSYPYEWPFSLHKRAALLQLDLLLELLERGFTLSDATAYNLQFVAVNPIFIDHLSIRPYADGEIWTAHRQFCMQFLNPLVMWSRLGAASNAWFRGNLEGIAPEDLARLLRPRDKLSWTIVAHVLAQGDSERRDKEGSGSNTQREARLPRNEF
jgi:hypothetical protein